MRPMLCLSARVTLAFALGVAALVAAPAPSSPAAPAAPAGADVATRIATLSGAATAADARAADATAARSSISGRLTTAQQLEAAARDRTDQLGQAEVAAVTQLEQARAALRALAVAAYRDGPSVSAISAIFSAPDAARLSYRRELVQRVGEHRQSVIDEASRAEEAARAAVDAAREERDRLHRQVVSLQAQLPAAARAVTVAQQQATTARFWLRRWQSIAGGTATRILGQPVLGSEELSRWFLATRGNRARTTVPIPELAKYYVEEGSAENVRGDIAWAQSILETAGFRFPAGGQVAPQDNNFAGIGACDSCATGRAYPDARTGVRAQMQLLRVYAQPGLTNGMLGHAAVDPRLDTHFLKGRVQTWNGLTGTWATARMYGDRILAIYAEMLAWLTDQAGVTG